MPLRYTDTDKWSQWFRELSVPSKLAYYYFNDHCDLAGFWAMDLPLVAFILGVPEQQMSDIFKELERVLVIRGETAWFKWFVKEQGKLPLNPKNREHLGILKRIVEKMDEFPEARDLALASPLVNNDILQDIQLGRFTLGKKKAPHKKTPEMIVFESEFEKEVWPEYPNKTGKNEARDSYVRARAAGVAKDYILNKIKDYMQYVAQRRQSGHRDLQFRGGNRWFKDGWEDEYEIKRAPTVVSKQDRIKQERLKRDQAIRTSSDKLWAVRGDSGVFRSTYSVLLQKHGEDVMKEVVDIIKLWKQGGKK